MFTDFALFEKVLILHRLLNSKAIMENYMAKAADAFLTSRPYGIRLDSDEKDLSFSIII